MFRDRCHLLLLCALAVSQSTSCGTLRPPSSPAGLDAAVAVLNPALDWHVQVVIEAVDGRRLGWLEHRAEVVPGSHQVRATLVFRGSSGFRAVATQQVHFEAEAGHTYEVHGDYHIYGPRLWIHDVTEGATVAVVETRPGRLPDVAAPASGSSPRRDATPRR